MSARDTRALDRTCKLTIIGYMHRRITAYPPPALHQPAARPRQCLHAQQTLQNTLLALLTRFSATE